MMMTALATGLFVTSCGAGSAEEETTPAPASEAIDLAGTHLVLSELNGEPVDVSVTAAFGEDGSVAGSGGCNRYNASAEVEGDSITFTPPASTMMACDEDTMAVESAYFEALLAASSFTATAETMTLADEGGTEIAAFAAQAQDLAGTSWTVTAYNDGQSAVVSVLEGTTLEVSFDEDGAISGNAGCNSVVGGFSAEGGAISFTDFGTTMMACDEPEGVMEQEVAFVAALESAATYTLEGDRLSMRTADDQGAVELVSK
nr:META domain-containing protein [Actinomycetales bacterium]